MKLPEEWKKSILVPIHKKGNKADCNNYRCLSLLPNTYKILSNILFSSLIPYAKQFIGDHQCGFRRNRSTIDHIFCIRQILEKKWEYNEEVHLLFIDFKKAYDSVRREVLYEVRFTVLSFSPHSTFCWWVSYQALAVASHGVWRRPAAISILEPHNNHEWRIGLAVNGLYLRDKVSIQKAPLRSAKCADNAGRPGDSLYNGKLQLLRGRSRPNSGQTHDNCVCRYIVGCNALPEVCKLNPAPHLLSLSVLWQYSSCRGTRLTLNSGLMTVLWQPGQYSAFGNTLHSFFYPDQQQISCSVHGYKTVNYHNAVAEYIPFIWQQIERNLT